MSGSVSRTAVNERNGGKTQLVSVTASATMLIVLLAATPLIRFLPVPVLTAIVVNALIGATEFGIARRLWRVNRVELGIFAGAFLGVLLLGAIKGVLVGMVLSFIDVLMRAAAPQRTFLGTLPGQGRVLPDRSRQRCAGAAAHRALPLQRQSVLCQHPPLSGGH